MIVLRRKGTAIKRIQIKKKFESTYNQIQYRYQFMMNAT